MKAADTAENAIANLFTFRQLTTMNQGSKLWLAILCLVEDKSKMIEEDKRENHAGLINLGW
ncbi:MAG: hypothetical protein AAE986_00305 [Thermoplasmataceae archaeon]